MAFEEMTADDAAIRLPEDGVDVQSRFAVRFRDIADQRQHLDLLIDRDALIVLLVPIEIADDGTLERADRGQPRGINLLLAHEFLQRLHRLVARREHDGVSRRRPSIQQFPAHPGTSKSPCFFNGKLRPTFRRDAAAAP